MKKGNLFKTLILFTFAFAFIMLVPGVAKADNTDTAEENYDPNIYIDNGVSYVISDLPAYYEHKHLTDKYIKNTAGYTFNEYAGCNYYKKISTNYIQYDVLRTATYDRDGVLCLYCKSCYKEPKIISSENDEGVWNTTGYERILLRIPRLKKINFTKKYTWDEVVLARDKSFREENIEVSEIIPQYLMYKDTYYTDVNNHKILSKLSCDPRGTNFKDKLDKKEQDLIWCEVSSEHRLTHTLTGTVEYTVKPYITMTHIGPSFYNPVLYEIDDTPCYYVVNPPDVYIGEIIINGSGYRSYFTTPYIPYTKNKSLYKSLLNYGRGSDLDDNIINELFDGCEIQFSTDKYFKKNVKIGFLNKKQLKYNTNYYIRCRTYKKVNGKYYYSKWSSVKKVKTLEKASKVVKIITYKFPKGIYPVTHNEAVKYSEGKYNKTHTEKY